MVAATSPIMPSTATIAWVVFRVIIYLTRFALAGLGSAPLRAGSDSGSSAGASAG
jgi:hypothetical protein